MKNVTRMSRLLLTMVARLVFPLSRRLERRATLLALVDAVSHVGTMTRVLDYALPSVKCEAFDPGEFGTLDVSLLDNEAIFKADPGLHYFKVSVCICIVIWMEGRCTYHIWLMDVGQP